MSEQNAESVPVDGETWANYLGRSIGRYTECDDPTSDYGREARRRLFDAYDAWCEAGRPSDGRAQIDGSGRGR